MGNHLKELPADLRETVEKAVTCALAEDVGQGDVTSLWTIPAQAQTEGRFLSKAEGIVAGWAVVRAVFAALDPELTCEATVQDGQSIHRGQILGRVQGSARSILTTERTALNFLQRLCGIATLTRKFVDAVAGTGVEIADTRKTTPGIRSLDRAAVRAGGGKNHRTALYDGILIKDNHIRLVGSIRAAVQAARSKAHSLFKVEIETTNLDQVREALAAGADIIMLDNMSLEMMGEAVQIIGDRALIEASGGIELDEVAEVAAAGVDIISVGTLTHSAPSLDISLELSPIE